MEELKPCRLCGGDAAELWYADIPIDDIENVELLPSFSSHVSGCKRLYRVACPCGARGKKKIADYFAIVSWNRGEIDEAK